MFAIATTLLLLSAPGGAAAPPSVATQDNLQASIQRQRVRVQSVRTELATAKLELTKLNTAQRALDRCDKAYEELAALATNPESPEPVEGWADLAHEFLELRGAALKAGAKGDATRDAEWTALAELIASPRVIGEVEVTPLSIDAEVEGHARLGNARFVIQLGRRAVPGLLNALEAADQNFSDPTNDPLYMLMVIDPVAADAYVGERNASGVTNVLWDLRFTGAISKARPFGGTQDWTTSLPLSLESRSLPHMLDYCDRLLSEPQLLEQIAPALRPVAERGICTEAMLAVMERFVASDLTLPHGVNSWWVYLGSDPTVRRVMLRALSSKNRDLAEYAERSLKLSDSNDGVYPVILAGSEKQRLHAISWLLERELRAVGSIGNSVASDGSSWWRVECKVPEENFVDGLLRDPSARVRAKTIRDLTGPSFDHQPESIGGWSEYGIEAVSISRKLPPIPLNDATLLRLAKDESVSVRSALAKSAAFLLEHRQLALVGRVMAADPDLEVRSTIAQALAFLDWHQQPQECIELLEEHFDLSTAIRFTSFSHSPFDTALHTEAGLQAMVRCAIDRNNLNLTRFVGFKGIEPRSQLRALPADLWVKFVAHFFAVGSSANESNFSRMGTNLTNQRRDAETSLAAVDLAATDSELSAASIYGLLKGRAVPESKKLEAAMIALLKAKEWHEGPGDDSAPLVKYINAMLRQYPESFRNGVAQRLLDDEDFAPLQLSRCFYELRLPISRGILDYARAHVDELLHWNSLVHLILERMRYQPNLVDIAWIQEFTTRLKFTKAGLELMGELRSPEFLPFLAEFIEGPASRSYYGLAVTALGSYMSDEAATLLLVAARKTGDESTRAKCLEHVEKIAALQDAEARWATRNLSKATREITVSKLMELLKDSDVTVRVEAINGLATWEAVEAMPELIGLLKDTNIEVSSAARAALARLNERN